MNISQNEYQKMVKEASPKSPKAKDFAAAFFVGGLICTFGQFLNNLYMMFGMSKTTAGALVSVTLVFIAVILTGIGVFDSIAKFAGAGTLVPITGFANAMVSPAIEYKTEGQVLGLGVKMFTVAGPVLVFGITAGVLYGIIYWIFGMI